MTTVRRSLHPIVGADNASQPVDDLVAAVGAVLSATEHGRESRAS